MAGPDGGDGGDGEDQTSAHGGVDVMSSLIVAELSSSRARGHGDAAVGA